MNKLDLLKIALLQLFAILSLVVLQLEKRAINLSNLKHIRNAVSGLNITAG